MSILLLFRHKKWHIKINKYLIFVTCMEIFVLIMTMINERLSYSYLCMIIASISITAFVVTNIKDNTKKMILLFNDALYLLFILDVISILLCIITGEHTNASYGLVGHKNYHAFLFILTLGFKLMNNRMNQERLLDINVIMVAFISIILEVVVDSTSGAITILCFSIALLLMEKRRIKLPSLTVITVGLLILNYILIFAISSTKWMQNLLALMGRDAGLTGRGQMWVYALDLIRRHPAYGYGYSQMVSVWSITEKNIVTNHCHNFFLNLVLTGGIPYFVVMMSFIFLVARKIKKSGSKLTDILTYTTGCYLLLGVSEIIINVNTMFWPLLTFGYYAQYLFENNYEVTISSGD